MDYKDTPSFYNNEEYFKKYLGCTSYYSGIQNVTEKLISLTKPANVLELGAALGATTSKLVAAFPDMSFNGTDIREDIVKQAEEDSDRKGIKNVSFFAEDMCKTAKRDLSGYDLIYLLYSFHHIPDPLGKKTEFLRDCYQNMKKGAYLLITETFLPEEAENICEDKSIKELFRYRSLEGYASTYWEALNGISKEDIKFARSVAEFSGREESRAGDHVYDRQDEYLVKFSWLKEQAEHAGFHTVIAEPVNCVMEKVLLLKKQE